MERLLSLVGLVVLLAIAFAFSSHKRLISPRVVVGGLALQFGLGLLILKTEPGRMAFAWLGKGVTKLLAYSGQGAGFIFGPLVTDIPKFGFIFAFQVLPTILFIASLMAVLYHLGVMQAVVSLLARGMNKLLGTSGAESLVAAANIFIGQTEAPLLAKPYLNDMTRSELMAVMTAGMATMSAGVLAAYAGLGLPANHLLAAAVMAAPAALVMAKIMVPETQEPKTKGAVKASREKEAANVIEAAAKGAGEGLHLALNVGAMLLAFIALIAMLNGFLGLAGGLVGFKGLSLQLLLGYAFAPLAFLLGLGTNWGEVLLVGNALGQKFVINEFVAFSDLAKSLSTMPERTVILATYALSGFANLSSIAIQIGGLGSLAPSTRPDVAQLGVRAMVAGFLASCMTACIAGILL